MSTSFVGPLRLVPTCPVLDFGRQTERCLETPQKGSVRGTHQGPSMSPPLQHTTGRPRCPVTVATPSPICPKSPLDVPDHSALGVLGPTPRNALPISTGNLRYFPVYRKLVTSLPSLKHYTSVNQDPTRHVTNLTVQDGKE